ncbi:baseplate J/gp47 family protein [Megasphaera elsdenii]|uniref:baseplate J/gp47 family protein n=1 Tax=Megasphaera elsdenii TaxID=907 RepID=UPI00242AD10D|nr:baseplate J/gp47 family protein [Megasphaera elsdenii]
MAYTAPYIDDAGLHIPTYADIRDDLVEQFKSIYGQDIYLENDSQDYQMISVFALKTYDTMQLLQIVYNNHSPKTAVGTGLDSLVKLNGIRRKEASHSTCEVTLTGTAGTAIAAGVVEDESGNQWTLPENIVLPDSTIQVTATCVPLGAIEAAAGTINKIANPQKGWTAVTNNDAAVPGRPVETDEQLRYRQMLSVAIPSQNMLDGTIAGIASVQGVTKYHVYDNDSNQTDANGIPGHTIAAVVEGGSDKDIAEQIYLRKGPGGGTYGTTTYEFVNLDGGKTPIHFFRPKYERIDVNVQIAKGQDYTNFIAEAIKTAVEQYLESLGIGNAVTVTGTLAAISSVITNAARPAYFLKGIKIGSHGKNLGAADVEVSFDAIAQAGDILVEVV